MKRSTLHMSSRVKQNVVNWLIVDTCPSVCLALFYGDQKRDCSQFRCYFFLYFLRSSFFLSYLSTKTWGKTWKLNWLFLVSGERSTRWYLYDAWTNNEFLKSKFHCALECALYLTVWFNIFIGQTVFYFVLTAFNTVCCCCRTTTITTKIANTSP